MLCRKYDNTINPFTFMTAELQLVADRERQTLAVVPVFRWPDVVPVSLLVFALLFSMLVGGAAAYGVGVALVHGAWIGSLFGGIFAVGAGWLIKIGCSALKDSVPRQVKYFRSLEAFQLRMLMFRFWITRQDVRRLWLRVIVGGPGFKRSPGQWVYLCFEDMRGRRRCMLLGTIPSLLLDERKKMLMIYNEVCAFSGIKSSPIEFKRRP
jgi:hypothetical protein